MLWRRLCLTVLLVAGFTLPAIAAEKPTLEIRLKSVDTLLGKFEYFAGLVGKEEEAKQLTGVAKAFTNAKGLEGVDTAKDFGFYSIMTANVVDSPLVLLIPMKNSEAFLGLLTGKLSLDPKKGADGVYSLDVPNVPQTVYFTFAEDYCHITMGNAKNLDAKNRISPKEFFAVEESALIAVNMHLERMPAEVKKVVFGQFELKLAEEKAKKEPNETPASAKLKAIMLDGIGSSVKSIFDDGKSLSLRVVVDPAKDDLGVALTLTAKPDSTLDAAMKANAKRGSTSYASVGGTVDATLAIGMNMAVPDSFQARLGELVELLTTEAVQSAKADEKPFVKQLMDAMTPSLKAGVLDANLVVQMNKEKQKLQASAAVKMVKAKEIENVVKTVAPFLPKDKATLATDTGMAGPATRHDLIFVDGKTEMEKAFGTATVKLAIADELMAMSIGKPESTLKTMFEAKPATAPSFQVSTAFATMAVLAESKVSKEKLAQIIQEIFGENMPVGADRGAFIATAGSEGLAINLSLKGKAFKLLYTLEEESKK